MKQNLDNQMKIHLDKIIDLHINIRGWSRQNAIQDLIYQLQEKQKEVDKNVNVKS